MNKINRLECLDILRSFSALGIVFYHYCIFFFTAQDFSAKLCCFSPLDFSEYSFIDFFKIFPLDMGKFFVAIFFLLSGFLIPYLIDHYPTRQAFLKNRFFRLWPIYAVGLLFNIMFVWGACLYNQIPFPYSFNTLLASFLCLRDFLDYPFITGVIWTFEVEVKFFLFCFIIYPLLKKPSPQKLLLLQIGLFFFCFNLASFLQESSEENLRLFNFFKVLSLDLRFFCFLFLGIFLSLFYEKKITFKNWVIFSIALIVLFWIETALIFKPERVFKYLVSYIPAWIIFVASTWPKEIQTIAQRQSTIFRFLADISYPLYLIHAIPGYILIYILFDHGIPIFIGILIAFILSIIFAVLLNNKIEKPVRAWSKVKS